VRQGRIEDSMSEIIGMIGWSAGWNDWIIMDELSRSDLKFNYWQN